ncbi:MAG: hypothetical protein FD163_1965 [Hyphomonadaceae bacterium]|nr:MAG: hypothetical protein FD128_2759 [Hyphomonadaceae bacterium]KAF0184391.1 MAG: hypothetical protein FD163_1965 [Hyphomonadaceae bacterium]
MTKIKLDDDWFDASHSECIQWLENNNCMDILLKWNWEPYGDKEWRRKEKLGLAKRYPSRILSPILRRMDCDDRLCATYPEVGQNECPVAMIHDFASEGWEGNSRWKSIADWYEDTEAWQW